METVGFSIRILGTDEQVKALGLIEQELKRVANERSAFNKQVRDSEKAIKELNKDLKQERELLKSGAISQKEYTSVTEKLNKLKQANQAILKDEANKLGQLRQQTSDLNKKRGETIKLINQENKVNQFAVGSYRDLNNQLVNARAKYKELGQAEREGAKGRNLQRKIQDLDGSLKKLDAGIGQYQRNVGNYGIALQNAGRKLDILTRAQERQVQQGNKGSETYRRNQAEIRRTKKEIDELKKSQLGYNSTANQGILSNGKLGNSFKSLGSALGLTVAGGIFAGGALAVKKAVEVFAEFEQAMAKVRAISGASNQEFTKLSASARKLGEETQFTASEVAGLQVEYAKLGFTTQQILDATEATLDLALATDSDLSQAALVAGATLRSFGLQANETTRVVDVMTVAFNSSALDLTKFETAMRQVAPVAKTFGFSLEDTTALLGELANAGFDASQAGTATRNILLNLADSGGKLAQKLGGAVSTLPELTKALKTLDKEGIDLSETLELTDKRSVAAFNRFIDGADDVDKLAEALNNASGAAAATADIMENTLQGDIKKLQSAFSELGIVIGEQLGGSIRAVVQGLTFLTQRAANAVINIKLILASLPVGPGAQVFSTTLLELQLKKNAEVEEEYRAEQTKSIAEYSAIKLGLFKDELEQQEELDRFGKIRLELLQEEFNRRAIAKIQSRLADMTEAQINAEIDRLSQIEGYGKAEIEQIGILQDELTKRAAKGLQAREQLDKDAEKQRKKNNETILKLTQQLITDEIALLNEGTDKLIKAEQDKAAKRAAAIEQNRTAGNTQSEVEINKLVDSLIETNKQKSADNILEIVKQSTLDQLKEYETLLTSKGVLDQKEADILLAVQQEISTKNKELYSTTVDAKIREAERLAAIETRVLQETQLSEEDKAKKILDINIGLAQAKYELLKKELELSENVTESQLELVAKFLDEINRLKGEQQSLGGDGGGAVGFVEGLFNVEEDDAERIVDSAVNTANEVYRAVLAIKSAQITQNLKAQKDGLEREEKQELALLKRKLEAGLITQEQYDKQKLEIEADTQKKIEKAEREAARKRQRVARADALINGAVAITKIFATVPPPASGILAGLQALITAAQLATIDQQQYGKGGLITGPSHSDGGVNINAEGGEGMINKRTMAMRSKVTVSGTPYEIASQLNSMNGYGVPFPNTVRGRRYEFGGVVASRPSGSNGGAISTDSLAAIASMINDQKVVFVQDEQDANIKTVKQIQSDSEWQ